MIFIIKIFFILIICIFIIAPILDGIRLYLIYRLKLKVVKLVVENYSKYYDQKLLGGINIARRKHAKSLVRIPAIYRVFTSSRFLYNKDDQSKLIFNILSSVIIEYYCQNIGIWQIFLLNVSKKYYNKTSATIFEEICNFIEDLEGEYFSGLEVYQI
jgi:hypothetical protein